MTQLARLHNGDHGKAGKAISVSKLIHRLIDVDAMIIPRLTSSETLSERLDGWLFQSIPKQTSSLTLHVAAYQLNASGTEVAPHSKHFCFSRDGNSNSAI